MYISLWLSDFSWRTDTLQALDGHTCKPKKPSCRSKCVYVRPGHLKQHAAFTGWKVRILGVISENKILILTWFLEIIPILKKSYFLTIFVWRPPLGGFWGVSKQYKWNVQQKLVGVLPYDGFDSTTLNGLEWLFLNFSNFKKFNLDPSISDGFK